MIKRLELKNITVFPEAELDFSPQLNVFVGENGSGKTHLLKILYIAAWEASQEIPKENIEGLHNNIFDDRLVHNLPWKVFK